MVESDPGGPIRVLVRFATIEDPPSIRISTSPKTSAHRHRLAEVAAGAMPFVLLSGARHRDPPPAIRYPQDQGGLILVTVLETDDDLPKVLLQPLRGVLRA